MAQRYEMLLVGAIVPNDWNDNEMTPEEQATLDAEVHARGDVIVPIVVRPLGDGRYEIVNGEHNWVAACRAGLNAVSCEVQELDDVEAMRETVTRNKHGERLKVRPSTLRAWVRAGSIPCYRLGPRATRFTRQLLDDFAATRLDRGRPF